MIEIGRITNQRYSTALLLFGSLMLGMILRKPFDILYSINKSETNALVPQQTLDASKRITEIEALFAEGESQLKAKKTMQAATYYRKSCTAWIGSISRRTI